MFSTLLQGLADLVENLITQTLGQERDPWDLLKLLAILALVGVVIWIIIDP